MRVQEIMTKDPDCCLPNDSVQKAAKIMKIIDAGVVPVVASGLDQKVIGIVTDRDLCLGVIAEGRDPATPTVKECMTGKVIICRPNDELQHAVRLMEENQIRRIPVVEDDGTLVGIISLADIAQAKMVDPAKAGNTLKGFQSLALTRANPELKKINIKLAV
jgi:CBS domain-containing protein